LFSAVKTKLTRLTLKHWLILALLVLALGALAGYFGLREIKNRLAEAGLTLDKATRVEATSLAGARIAIEGLQISVEAREARALCRYHNDYYVASAGGLLCYDPVGKLKAHFTTLDGLPSLDLTTLAVFRDRLYIGSADSGLSVFDGQNFLNYQFQ